MTVMTLASLDQQIAALMQQRQDLQGTLLKNEGALEICQQWRAFVVANEAAAKSAAEANAQEEATPTTLTSPAPTAKNGVATKCLVPK